MLTLRKITLEDIPLLELWDTQKHVIDCHTDTGCYEPGEPNWHFEIESQNQYSQYYIAEKDGRAIGVMQVIDPHMESTHYWGDIEPNLRAVDIWIGMPEDLNKGFGTQMMQAVLKICFDDSKVTGVYIDPLKSNINAIRFYKRLGFQVVGQKNFGKDECLVMRLMKAKTE